ncbi:MAG: hypothetical protein EDX89_16245 [Acidobacteria bacterium]|nr:MAG: hypothetical protein EDX89_16245 [Acidobacteriota bacterium]
MRPPPGFEITGGSLCLDLPNTLGERRRAEPKEHLHEYADLVAWGLQAGAIDERTARRLTREAGRDPRAASRALQRARGLREELFRLFAAVVEGRALPEPSLAALDEALAAALSARRLVRNGAGVAWAWREEDPPALDRVLWPVLVSAAELLTSGETGRVRWCEGEGCAWLFLDRSRNGSRRWCDMTVCGNREKARRHRRRPARPGPARRGPGTRARP